MIYRVASRKAPRGLFSQVIYCRGYSGEEPPLPIPNREVKLTIADGTAPPGGRVGSCGSLECQTSNDAWHSSFMALWGSINQRTKPHVSPSPNPFPRGRGVGRFAPKGSRSRIAPRGWVIASLRRYCLVWEIGQFNKACKLDRMFVICNKFCNFVGCFKQIQHKIL